MEAHFPEMFGEYERLDVDCVLFSSTEGEGHRAPESSPPRRRGTLLTNSYWVSYSVDAQQSRFAPAGVISPGGDWLARCPQDGSPSVVTVELDESAEDSR